MKGIYLTRTVNITLVPAFPSDYEIVKSIPPGELIIAELKLDRNPKFHRKFFALLKFLQEHLPEEITNKYNTPDEFRMFVQYHCGITEEFQDEQGVIHILPKSLAFGALDEIEFGTIYRDIKMKMINDFFSGDTTEAFEAELATFM